MLSSNKKPQDSVVLYQHRLRVDRDSIKKLREVVALAKTLKQQHGATQGTQHVLSAFGESV